MACRWRCGAFPRRRTLRPRLLGHAPIRAARLGTDDEPAPFVAQLARWVRTGRFTSAQGEVDYDIGLAELRMPLLTLVGGGDRLCTFADAVDLARRLRPTRQATIVVGRAHGFAHDASHFTLFTDRRSEPAWQRIAAFLRGDSE